jgi:hypothetical protein
MRRLVLLPLSALVLLVGCGSSNKLTPSIAEKLIAPDYPVMVPIKVPKVAKAAKGSAEFQKIETINGMLTKGGAFTLDRQEQGDQVTYTYQPAAGAPGVVAQEKTWLLPAAEATFVKVTRIEPKDGHFLAQYQIRLAKPTPHFGLLQFLHPQVRMGDTKDRHALIERRGNEWALMRTDEDFPKRR